jgi:hypothetical protein
VNLPGTICIRCGFEPLEGVAGEWWCPECWSSGLIVKTPPADSPDELLHACRQIVDVQRSQLKAKRNGESLGEASILGGTYDGHVVIEPKPDDTAPWEKPAPKPEAEPRFKAGLNRTWVTQEFPELDWLVHLPPKETAPFLHPSLRFGLHRVFPDVPNHVWKVLLDG